MRFIFGVLILITIFLTYFFYTYRKKKSSVLYPIFFFNYFLLTFSYLIMLKLNELNYSKNLNYIFLSFYIFFLINLPIIFYHIIEELVNDKMKFSLKNIYYTLIFLAFNLICITLFYFNPNEKSFVSEVADNIITYIDFFVVFFINPIINLYFLFKAFKVLEKIKTEKNIYFRGIIALVFYLLFISVWYFKSVIIGNSSYSLLIRILTILFFVSIAYIFYSFIRIKLINRKKLSINSEILPNEVIEQMEKKLDYGINLNKFHLKDDLTIKEFAKKIGTNEKYLSQYINFKYGVNFTNYINNLRITETINILNNPKFSNYTIESIASMSGFSSKSTFNAAFKKKTGLTPSEFKLKVNTK